MCKFNRMVNLLEQYLLAFQKGYQYSNRCNYSTVKALRSKKRKSTQGFAKDFIDTRIIRTVAGKGGDGCISFLQIFKNENAGPDGGDGGNGGHVIFEANCEIRGLDHIQNLIEAKPGEKGFSKNCCGRNSDHVVIQVPAGTIVKNQHGRVIADLNYDNMMFIAARGGAGGKGNTFFSSDLETTPKVAEIGGDGEILNYTLELSSMAHFGLLGFPNAGKSTLLQAVTRANPKVAAYPFTTLKPHLGVVQYTDLEQITIADLPGLIEGSHQNKGLGITFLRHAERCMGLLILLDMSDPEPWKTLHILRNEVLCFSSQLARRPQIIVANKMDLSGSEENLREFAEKMDKESIIPISAKCGQNLGTLLDEIRKIYDDQITKRQVQIEKDTHIINKDPYL